MEWLSNLRKNKTSKMYFGVNDKINIINKKKKKLYHFPFTLTIWPY